MVPTVPKDVETKEGKKLESGIGEETILDQIAKLSLAAADDDNNNGNKRVVEAESGGRNGNSEKEDSTNDNEHQHPAADSKNEENSKSKQESPNGSQSPQSPGRMSPAEFFQTSRLRSSALANKLSTTQTYGGSVDLPNAAHADVSSQLDEITKGVESVILGEKKEDSDKPSDETEKDDKKEKSVEDEDNQELIDRSPVPGYAGNRHAHHPYQQPQQQPRYSTGQASPSRGYYQVKADEPASYSPAYYMEQQRSRADGRQAYQQPAAPQAVPSPTYAEYGNYNNAMWSPPNYYQQQEMVPGPPMTNHYNCVPGQQGGIPDAYVDISPPSSMINSLADMCQYFSDKSPPAALPPFSSSPMQPDSTKSDGAVDKNQKAPAPAEINIEELPDELCDFILTYSRHYSKSDAVLGKSNPPSVSSDENQGGNRSAASTPSTSGYETVSKDGQSTCSAGDSILSPSSTFYTQSPNAYSPNDGKDEKSPSGFLEEAEKQGSVISARQRLREHIDQKDLDAALAWAMRCCQTRPEALFFRDKDGDSLLHIVIWHKDLAKTYVLTEIILKSTAATQAPAPKLFDLPNKQNETPLFLAVEKGLTDVVAYLLECGADPTVHPSHGDGDPPLHYAAARGMADVVQTLCAGGRVSINLLNGIGMTPLLCAVKNHGILDAESQTLVDNTTVIKMLLKAGADACIQDAVTGKSVLHYCVDRMDPALIQASGFADKATGCINRERIINAMANLVNSSDYNGFTPLSMLSGPINGGADEEKLRQKMSKLLLEYSVGQNLSADDFGDLSYLLSDQVALDNVQFTVLDEYLSPSAY